MRQAAAAVLLLAGCAQPGDRAPLTPEEQARLVDRAQELVGVDPAALSPGKREEMRRACNGLDVADLLGHLPENVPWRAWCAQVWGTKNGS